MALPDVRGVRRDEWDKHNFDRESALRVVQDSESTAFFVNLDNVYLANDIKRRSESRGLAEAKFKYGMTLFGLALLKSHSDKARSDADDDPEIDVAGQVAEYSRAFAPILLPMIDGLGELDDSFDETDEEEEVA